MDEIGINSRVAKKGDANGPPHLCVVKLTGKRPRRLRVDASTPGGQSTRSTCAPSAGVRLLATTRRRTHDRRLGKLHLEARKTERPRFSPSSRKATGYFFKLNFENVHRFWIFVNFWFAKKFSVRTLLHGKEEKLPPFSQAHAIKFWFSGNVPRQNFDLLLYYYRAHPKMLLVLPLKYDWFLEVLGPILFKLCINELPAYLW